MRLSVDVSAGELLESITILEIKLRKLPSPCASSLERSSREHAACATKPRAKPWPPGARSYVKVGESAALAHRGGARTAVAHLKCVA